MNALKLSRILLATNLLLLAVGLGFRAFLYAKLYIGPNQPYGIADLIELALGGLRLALFVASALAALVLAIRGPKANRIAAAWLAGSAVVMAASFDPLHALAAQWGSR